MAKCDTCVNFKEGFVCCQCIHDRDLTDNYKPMTNGDKIRAMTDEELCAFILDKQENGHCFNNKCYHNDPNKGCDDCTLEWLKQEAVHD